MKKLLLLAFFAFCSVAAYAQVPDVSAVTFLTPAAGTYTTGQVMTIRVFFDENVDVVLGGGGPRIQLNITPTTRYAVAAAGTSLSSVDFSYTIQAGDLANPLDYASTGALTLQSGTINATAGATPAVLTLPAVGSLQQDRIIDAVAPRITSIVRQNPTTSPTNADALVWDVQFNEPVLNVNAADFTASGTTATVASAVDQTGNLYRVTVSGGNLAGLDGTVTLGFAGGQNITDAVGNALSNLTPTGTNDNSFVVDNTAPRITSIVRQSPATSPTNADVLVWDVQFDEPVLNVGTADFTATGGTTATVTAAVDQGGNLFRVTVSGGDLASFEGTVTLGFAGGQNITDVATNALTNLTPTGANNNFFVVDNTAPRITSIVRQNPATSPTNADILVWDVQFDEPVLNVSTGDFTITGSTATVTAAVDQTGNLFRITASGGNLATVTATVTLGFAGGQNITDASTNPLSNLTPTGANDNFFVLDNTAPRITSIVRQSPATSPTNADILVWDVQFDEPVLNVSTGDFTITGSTATVTAAVDQGSNLFRITASGGNLATVTATVTLGFAGGQNITDAVTNALTNFTPTGVNNNFFVVDNTAPRITSIVRQSPTTSPTNANTLVWDVQFDEPVLNVGIADFTATGGTTATVTAAVDQGGNLFRITVSGGDLAGFEGTVTLGFAGGQDITDAVTNPLTNFTPTGANNNFFVVDNTAPRITSIVRQSPASSPTNADILVWDMQFDEPVLNVSNGDFTITGSTATVTAVVDQGGNLFRITASGGNLATVTATVTLGFAGGQNITDAATNALSNFTPTGTNNNFFVVDNTAPTVTITRQVPPTSPTTASTITFRVTFNENVANVDLADFELGAASTVLGGTLNMVTPVSGSIYDVEFIAVVGQTTTFLDLDFAVGQNITDAVGNPFAGTVTLEETYVVDNTLPGLSDGEFTLNPNGAGVETITFTLNEPITLADNADVLGFSVNSGSIAMAKYTLATNTVTLTNGGADGTWSLATTVTYTSGSGNIVDLIGQSMASIAATLVTIQNVNLGPGDIAFTTINTDSPDGFTFVLLKNIPSGTVIKFTDNGWTGDGTPGLDTDETTITWTATANMLAGTEIRISEPASDNVVTTSAGSVTDTGADFSLSDNGDHVFAYQGSSATPTFLAGIYNSTSGAEDGTTLWSLITDVDGNNNRSGLPITNVPPGLVGLTNGVNAISFSGSNSDNRQYRTSGVPLTGSAQQLRSGMNSAVGNWNSDNDNDYALTPSVNKFPVRPVVTLVTVPNVSMKVGDVVTATITVHDDRDAPHTFTSGTIGGGAGFALSSFTRINATTYTTQFTIAEGGTDVAAASNIPVNSLLLTSNQGNAMSAAYTTAIIGANDRIDANSPRVLSINRQSATTPWSTTSFGTSASSVVFRVTFSENVNLASLSAADFTLTAVNVNVGGAIIGAPVVVAANTTFDITVSGYTGTGTLGLNYVDNEDANAVQDVAGNSTITGIGLPNGSFTGQVFSIVLPEPTENVNATTVVTTPTNTSIQIDWTEPSPLPTNYLIVARATSGGSFPVPFNVIDGNEDGTLVANDLVLADGTAAVNVAAGTNTHTFTGLQSGTSYDFVIYVYNLSANNAPDNVDYLTAPDVTPPTAIPAFSVFTTTASVGSITQSATPAPATIHSVLGTSYLGTNFNFVLQDDGLSPGDDNSRTRFNKIVFTANPGTTVTDWNGVIAAARLTDITAVPGPISGTSVNATLITGNTIEFSGISTALNALGSMEDNQIKEYRLEIQLKSNIDGTIAGATKETIDNTRFEFLVNASSFTYEPGSSQFEGTQAQNSDPLNANTNNTITVTASTLGFSTQPPPTSLVLTNVVSTPIAPDFSNTPVARAIDANGNTDRNYINTLTISNSGLLPMSTNLLPVDNASPNAGVYTFPVSFQYTDDGAGPPNNGTLILSGAGVTNGTSSNVSVSYSATTTVVAGAAPSPTISDLVNADPGQDVFTFVVTDDGGVGGDGSPTRIQQIVINQGPANDPVLGTWTQAILGARLTDNFGNTMLGTVNAGNITFTGINITTLGFITDSQPKTYRLSIWLRPSLLSTLPQTIDNKAFAFTVTDASIFLTAQSSTMVGGQTVNSAAGNSVNVITDRLIFTTQPSPTAFVLTDLVTPPVVTARNINGNTDHNFNGAGNTVTISNTETIAMSNLGALNTLVPSAGVITFPANFQYNDDGTGAIGNGTLTVVGSGAPAVTPATSNAVTVSYDNNNRIIASATHTEQLTFSSLNNGPGFVPVFDFSIVDDNGNSPAGDGSPTRFNQIIISQQTGNDIANWQDAIGGATLTVGASTLIGTINPTDITFTGLATTLTTDPGHIIDGGTKTYTLNIFLRAAMGGNLPPTVDNLNLAFEILEGNIGLTAQSSNFNAVGTQVQNSGATNNAVDVVATKLNFTQLDGSDNFVHPPNPFPSGGSINTPFSPRLGLEAQDANGNLDVNFAGSVNSYAVSPPAATDPAFDPVGPAGIFAGGRLKFPAGFNYVAGNNVFGDLTIGTTGPAVTSSNFPPTHITISSSKDAYVYFNPSYTYPPLINTVNQQAGSLPASTSAISIPSDPVASLGELILSDGGAASYEASGNTTHTPTSDSDGAFTRISEIEFSVTNHADLRTLALYNAAGTKISSDESTGATVRFTGLNIQAPDNGSIAFTVRASFNSTIAADHDLIQLRVTDVMQSAGSLLYEGPTPPDVNYKGGILNGDLTPPSVNRIDVVATKLVFTQDPPPFAGVREPVPYSGTPATMVVAHDANDNLDTDFDFALRGTMGDIASPAPLITNSFPFSAGMLDLGAIRYNGTGVGTLTVSVSTGLPFIIEGGTDPDPVITAPSNAISTAVDVINTVGGIATGGVVPGPTANLAGGAVDRVIFGVTFSAPYQAGGHPDLTRFRIKFGLPPGEDITNILTNWRIYENTSGTFGGPNITSLTGTINVVNANQELEVVFGTPRDLSTPKSYFLQTNVVATASGSTPPIQPQVVDGIYGSATDGNLIVSRGSAEVNVIGNIYNFSAIFPPDLTGSYPASGQLNVSTNQLKVSLNFSVPVWTLDNVIYLNDQTDPLAPVVPLTADNGQFAGGTGTRANPLIFSIPPGSLQPDHVYYITVAQGVFNGQAALDNTGIMDQAGNRFPGISYPGTLYFKTANPNAPNMISTPTAPANPSATGSVVGGVISATFDQVGKAYYLILPNGTATPSPDQIKGTAVHGSAVAKGSFDINQVNPIPQFGSFTPLVPLAAGLPGYDVWISATAEAEFSPTGLKADAVLTQVPATNPAHFGDVNRILKTGTITANLTSNIVTGVGTSFLTELVPGRTIFEGSGTDQIGVVATITDNTTLVLATNALNAITNGAYRASGFELGGTGPTLDFVPTAAPASVTLNSPSLSICTGAFQVLSQPFTITESSAANNFSGGGTQSFNLVLPAGFEFDVLMNGSVPQYGTLTLVGSDFTAGGNPQLSFIGNSILTVSYVNSGSSSVDKIIISGLRVRAGAATSGDIIRFGGNALLGAMPELSTVAGISSATATGITFYNSYSIQEFNNTAVTTIPDNFDDLNIAQPLVTQLFPLPPFGDYGPSTFSGQGVNVNLLGLTAVTLGTPFNITINHIDNNGCPSVGSEQYTVYDSRTAIADLNTEYCTRNDQFTISNPTALATTLLPGNMHTVTFDRLQSYYLDDLTADLPAGITDPDDAIVEASDQIIFGTGWKNVLNNALLSKIIYPGPTQGGIAIGPNGGYQPLNNPLPGPPAHEYFDYIFDEATLMNAKAIDPSISRHPYEYSKQTSPQGNVYYSGGSLGIVQFTGQFQSIANAGVRIPLVQKVRIFLPAAPIIETSAPSYLDTADPLNIPGPGNPGAPAVPVVTPEGARSSNRGTPVFCQLGGIIQINAYPAASPGSSLGRFTVVDHTNPTDILYDNPPGGPAVANAGFTDNTNGTAQIDPTILAIQNGYRDIRITYTYKENNSPCQSQTSQVIRISPNPVAAYTFVSTPGNFVVNTASKCAGEPITFTSSATSADPINNTISNFDWNFGDPTSSDNAQNGVTLGTIAHTFATPSAPFIPYVVTHRVTSFWGCPSVTTLTPTVIGPITQNLDVGSRPVVNFSLTGVARGDVFSFVSTNGTNNSTVSPNDAITQYLWDFGQGAPGTNINLRDAADGLTTDAQFNADVVNFTYSAIGPHKIDLRVQSNLGCQNSLSLQGTYRDIVVLERTLFMTSSDVYEESFNAGSGNWQVWSTGVTTAEIEAALPFSSWSHGTPANPFGAGYQATYDLIAGTGSWKTNLTGNYNAGESSALYSPSFDLAVLERPMISFNSIVQTALSDGVVLQFSLDNLNIADPNKVWQTLGTATVGGSIGTGEDWFNQNAIAGKPGEQAQDDFGWSGADRQEWLAPKHTLDVVGGGTNAVFRFALGVAAGSQPNLGFFLDNVRIGDRTRTILLESFANTSNTSPNEKTEAEAVAAFQDGSVGTEVVKLNYHVNFPGKDPFNEDNPADPSSRALFYNITSTPKSVLDGEKDPQDRLFSVWGQALYDVRTLQLAQADITITPTVDPGGSLSIAVDVRSNVLTGLQANTILHVVLLEQQVPLTGLPSSKQSLVNSGETSFEYVVKKMLPSAAGTDFGGPLAYNATRSFGPFVWMPEASKLYPNVDDLAVAVFLQQANAPYEVYQVELEEPIADPPVVTGLEPLASELVLVYPNPASDDMTVQLPGQVTKPASIQLIDQTGRVSLRSTIPEGSDRKTVNVHDLSAGVYILTVDMGSGVLTRKKVIVVHQE